MTGPASRTRSKTCLFNVLPDEILQMILGYVTSVNSFNESIRLRLVCHRFNAFLSSLLLSSIFASALPNAESHECHLIRFYKNCSSVKSVTSGLMDAQLCPIDAHIRHVTVKMSLLYEYYDDGVPPRKIKAYESLLRRIERHMPALRSIKLLHDLDGFDLFSGKTHVGMNTLTTSALNCIPANIHVEVELEIFAFSLDTRSVSSRPADWTGWLHDNKSHTSERRMIEQWPKCIEEVWGMTDSVNIGAHIMDFYSPPQALENLPRGAITNRHIFHLFERMVPGKFLCLQFPRGFPPHLKRLNIRDPLIVNTCDILRSLRNCQHLNDLSLFVVLNTEAHDGLPPGLETLELFESGGTILPEFYTGLRNFRYTFIGDPKAGDRSTVRHFIEHTHIGQLELNFVSTRDLEESCQEIRSSNNTMFDKKEFGRHLLQTMSFNQFGNCRISKRATPTLKEYVISLASSHDVRRP